MSPQCNGTKWRVIRGSARPAGLSQADRPDRAVSVIFPEASFFRPDSKLGDPSVHFDHLDDLFNMAMSNLAFDNIYGGVILYPCFTIVAYAPFNVVSCIFSA